MKLETLVFLSLAVVLVHCGHTFWGTNIQKQLFYRTTAQYSSKIFQKRVEYLNYTLPQLPQNYGRFIQVRYF